MAETAVSFVVDRLVSLLANEVNLLGNLHRDIADIKSELQSIQSFLKVADSRAEKEGIDDTVKAWVDQVREAAYSIEDVIDEYLLHVAKRHPFQGAVSFFSNNVCLMTNVRARRKIASKLQDIKTRLVEIKERRQRYHFHVAEEGSKNSADNVSMNDPRMSFEFAEEEDIVGVEIARDELINCLVGGASKRKVISIVGMGGLGKTTLAKLVYDNEIVKKHFECCAWITVSHSYTKVELLKNLTNQLCLSRKEQDPEDSGRSEATMLIYRLREYLQEKRYVIVFDDVWKVEFWGDIEHALLDNNGGSRILITTRIKDVADFCKKSSFVHVHELQPLSREMAWKLFCKKAFTFEGHCPPELEKLTFDIVKKCRGLPLAILAIGGLLSTKNKVPWEWQTLLNSLSSELECNPHLTNITYILSLSYYDLPYYLKPCFLYFGIFPEDYSIDRPRLIELWIAEGFIREQQGKVLEQVANEHLNELIQRNVVHVSWGEFSGVNKRLCVHDLMRDVILSKIRELNFCLIAENKDATSETTRRISIYNSVDNLLGTIRSRSMRCIFLFGLNKLPRSFIVEVFNSCKLLKVLDFEDSPLDFLPEEVGNLYHLRYLSVKNTKVKMLPKSIGKLKNLQTLNVGKTPLCQLPNEINRLLKLRHLLATNYNPEIDFSLGSVKGVRIPKGIGCLHELQTLSVVEVNNGNDIVKELGMLTQLKVLSIAILTREAGKALCNSISKMNYLTALDVHLKGENEILDLQSVSSPFQYMFDCFLRGSLESLPHWLSKLHNIVTIGLFFSKLTDDPLKDLEALPNLEYLYLYEAYNGQKLHIHTGGFKKLRLLSLRMLNALHTLMIDQGTFPLLEELRIGPSPCLTEVPVDIHNLRAVKTLVFYDMPEEFKCRMRPNDGEDHWKVSHIGTVLFRNKIRGENYEAYNLAELTRRAK